MSNLVTCPNCETGNPLPPVGKHKTTCSSCGMILVMEKVIGPDWEALRQAPSGVAGPKKPLAVRKAPAASPAPGAAAGRPPVAPVRRAAPPAKAPVSSKKAAAEPAAPRTRTRGEGGGVPPRRPRSAQAVHPGLLWGSIAGVVVVAVVFWFVFQAKKDEAAKDESADTATKTAAVTPAADTTTAEEPGTPAPAAGAPETASGAAPAAGTPPAGTPPAAGEPAAPTAAPAGETPVAAPAKRGKTPAKVEMKPFDPPADADADKVEAARAHVETLKDVDATVAASRARDALVDMPRIAVPLLINALLELDLESADDAKRGFQMIETLLYATGDVGEEWFVNDYWKVAATEGLSEDENVRNDNAKWRRQAIEKWWTWWNDNRTTWKPETPSEEEETW